jgi:hypothetical protein
MASARLCRKTEENLSQDGEKNKKSGNQLLDFLFNIIEIAI